MADSTRTYTGHAPRGRVILPTRSPQFVRGEPLTVTDDEAALLDESGEWTKPTSKPPKSQGSKPDTKES